MNLNEVCESVDSLRTNLKNRNVVVDISNITDTLDDVASCLRLLNTLVDLSNKGYLRQLPVLPGQDVYILHSAKDSDYDKGKVTSIEFDDYTMYIFISIDGGSSSASFGVDDIDEVVFKNKESLQNYIDKHKGD